MRNDNYKTMEVSPPNIVRRLLFALPTISTTNVFVSGSLPVVVVRDCALQHMADAIQLVSGCLRRQFYPQRLSVTGEIGVQIAARLLDCHDLADHRVCCPSQLRLIVSLQLKSRSRLEGPSSPRERFLLEQNIR